MTLYMYIYIYIYICVCVDVYVYKKFVKIGVRKFFSWKGKKLFEL